MTLEWWQALVLGALQGLTEFLPISSSGHLVLAPFMLSWPSPGLAFDAAVHGGTAGALVVAFRTELLAMARGFTGSDDADARLARRLAVCIVVGTAPLVIVGLSIAPIVEAAFTSAATAATGLLGTAVILVGGERWRSRRTRHARTRRSEAAEAESIWSGDWVGAWPDEQLDERADARADAPPEAAAAGDGGEHVTVRADEVEVGADPDDPHGASLDRLTVRAALLVGLGQAVAVLPGVSRSGTTIMTGVVTGLTREAAARFAFLLALPALAGATLLSLRDLIAEGPGTLGWAALFGAIAMAFVTGLVAIHWLLRLVARTSLRGFAVYCVAAGAAGWLAVLMLGARAGGG